MADGMFIWYTLYFYCAHNKRFLYCYVLMYFDTDRFTHNHETVAIDTALGCAIICARFSEILKTISSAISSASSLTNTYFTTFVHAIILSMIFRKTVRGDHDTIEISSLVIENENVRVSPCHKQTRWVFLAQWKSNALEIITNHLCILAIILPLLTVAKQ